MTTSALPPVRLRHEIIGALRDGTVPRRGLEHLAVGLERFTPAFDEELERAAQGGGVFKALRGDYGSGKTFFARWVQHRARAASFATAEVQISETETPLYRMETVYRRALESLRTQTSEQGTFRALVERWFLSLEEEVAEGRGQALLADADEVARAVGDLLEARLADVSATQPQFAAALRAAHRARVRGDVGVFEGLVGWLAGQPHVGAEIKRHAAVKGEIDHFAAGGFLRGLLRLLEQTGRRGLLLVLDEVETVQRMRSDARKKSLNALRQLLDDLSSGRYPGLYVLVTGTPAFFESPHGVRQLPPLAQRVHVDFGDDPRFDSSRAVQVRLLPFDRGRLLEVGRRVRDLYPAEDPEGLAARVPDAVIAALADQVTGKLGGQVGIAPRLFIRKLVALLDVVREHQDYDPVVHHRLELSPLEMRPEERVAAGIELTTDEIELDLGAQSEDMTDAESRSS